MKSLNRPTWKVDTHPTYSETPTGVFDLSHYDVQIRGEVTGHLVGRLSIRPVTKPRSEVKVKFNADLATQSQIR